jgi:hypothetical protein
VGNGVPVARGGQACLRRSRSQAGRQTEHSAWRNDPPSGAVARNTGRARCRWRPGPAALQPDGDLLSANDDARAWLDARGIWVVCHGSCLRAADGSIDSVAVVVEPATATQIAPIMVQAYDLSDREKQVCAITSRPSSTKWVCPVAASSLPNSLPSTTGRCTAMASRASPTTSRAPNSCTRCQRAFQDRQGGQALHG